MAIEKLSHSLPQRAYSAKQVLVNEKIVAKNINLPMYDLMQRAGASVFEHLTERFNTSHRILVICGKGNNGGDGFIAARLAIEAGYTVSVLALVQKEKIKGDALKAYNALEESLQQHNSFSISHVDDLTEATRYINDKECDLIVDCIFGIGFSGQLSDSWQNVINAVNKHHAKTIAVDIPSGLCADTGNIKNVAVTANSTVTFIVLKQGLLTGQAAAVVGQLFLADLKINQVFQTQVTSTISVQGSTILPTLRPRLANYHKGNIGMVLAMGGNKGMPGAIRLASEGALRAGSSLVSVCCFSDNQSMVFNGRPELMLAPSEPKYLVDSPVLNKAKALLIGPGLGQDDWSKSLLKLALSQLDKRHVPIVVDADALHLLGQLSQAHSPPYYENWVLTPHPGEAAALLSCTVSDIENDRISAVTKIADLYGGVCILKGAGSLISDGKHVWVNSTGNAGMASGGMGDVLSGIIAGLILQTNDLFSAARLAVSIHGQAADIVAKKHGERGILASDLFEPLQTLVNKY